MSLRAVLLAAVLVPGPFGHVRAQDPALTLTGRVADDDDLPLASVLVYLDSAVAFAWTDSAGGFRLDGVAPGSHRIHFRKYGLAPRSFDFVVGDSLEDSVQLGTVVLQPGRLPSAALGGTVTDAVSGEPVLAAQVVLNGVVVAETDERGEFAVPSTRVAWGANLVIVRRIGYAPLTDGLWIDETSSTFELSGSLDRLPVRLPEVVVEGDRTIYEFGPLRGFWRRRQARLGTFFTRWEIQARDPIFTSDLFKELPGVTVRRSVSEGAQVLFFGRQGAGCRPTVWINGMRLLGPIDIDTYTPPGRIQGIEVYKGAAVTPVQFDDVRGCGAIVIWTR